MFSATVRNGTNGQVAGSVVRLKALVGDSLDDGGDLQQELLAFVEHVSLLKAGVTEFVGLSADTPSPPTVQADSDSDASDKPVDIHAVVTSAVCGLMEDQGQSFQSNKTFYQLGLDSLDHMELATLLGHQLNQEVDSAWLFSHDTPDALIRHLGKLAGKKSRSGSVLAFWKRSKN